MSFEIARRHMVDGQLRPAGITNAAILKAMAHVPREHFTSPTYMAVAYCDTALPLRGGQMLWPPSLLAQALQALALRTSSTVLAVNIGTGYTPTVLSYCAQHVFGIESDLGLLAIARDNVARYGKSNIVTLEAMAPDAGWPNHGPYDAILVEGADYRFPTCLLGQLRTGGRLAVVVGTAPAMQLVVYTKTHADHGIPVVLNETVVPYLPGTAGPGAQGLFS